MFEKYRKHNLAELEQTEINLQLLTLEILMTLADNVVALQTAVSALQTSVAAIPTTPVTPPPPVVDFTPVLTAISAEDAEHAKLQDTADAILAQLTPTPPSA